MDAASAHLVARAGADHHAILDRARELLADRHHVHHGTFQVEPDTHEGCHDITW
jgi:cobalt-zinc-cadmium efflux system protein